MSINPGRVVARIGAVKSAQGWPIDLAELQRDVLASSAYGSMMTPPNTNAIAPPILLAGPTASGKSALALKLAAAVDGVIVNADALQVYRELSVLTARPSPADEASVPHMLYGHVAAREAYSVGRYIDDARAVLATTQKRLIFVGGTGLYFKALLEGLSPVPEIDAAVRAHWRMEAQRLGAAALHATLAARDPEMAARLRPSDPQRITRALEVLDSTGHSLASWQRLPGIPVLPPDVVRLVMRPDRSDLRGRCDARFDLMMASGALDEARSLADAGVDPASPIMGALGLAPLLASSRGACSLSEAVEQGKLDTWRYVKRQFTWLKRHMISWNEVQKDILERNDRSIMQIIENSTPIL